MIEVIYPSGVKRWFHWINQKEGYGYYRNKGKIYRYTLPKDYKNNNENEP